MNPGGCRSSLGPLACGLVGCTLLIAVLGLWLSAGPLHSSAGHSKIGTSVSHAVVLVHPAARPVPYDQDAVRMVPVVLTVALGLLLVRRRRVVLHRARPVRRPSGRALPGPLIHH